MLAIFHEVGFILIDIFKGLKNSQRILTKEQIIIICTFQLKLKSEKKELNI